MSYEIKIHLCDKQKLTKNNTFFDVVSTIDLRAIGASNAVAKYITEESERYPIKEKYSNNDVHIFASDNSTRIFEDLYGNALWEVCPKKLLKHLRSSYEKTSYRRFGLAISSIEKFIKYFDESNITVICEGR